MCISSIVKKTLFPLVFAVLLTVLTIPVMAEDIQSAPEESTIEQSESLPPVPDAPTDEVTIDSESSQIYPEATPDSSSSEPEQETIDILPNDTTQTQQDATALMIECLQDIRTCISIIVYIIFPLISAITLIKWFIARPFSNYVS